MRNITTLSLSLQQPYFLKNYGQETCTVVCVLWEHILFLRANIFLKITQFNIPKDPQAPYALQCNVNNIRPNNPKQSNLNRRWNTNMQLCIRIIKIIFKYGRFVKNYNIQVEVSYWSTAHFKLVLETFLVVIKFSTIMNAR